MSDQNSIRSFANLKEEIDRVQQTVTDLRENGHPCPDAERQLQQMKNRLSLLPARAH